MSEDQRRRVERVARDAVRALEPYDPALATALRRELNSVSTLPVNTVYESASRLSKLEGETRFLLDILAENTEHQAEVDLLNRERIDEIRRTLG